MFFLLGGNEKKTRKAPVKTDEVSQRVKELFLSGRFPVVTTDRVEGKEISKVLGLVCCRGYDSEEAFFGMASRAVNKGAHAIVGYIENVAFHPDGSKYFSCYGTAVMFEWEPEEKFGAAALLSLKRPHLAGVQEEVRQDLLHAAALRDDAAPTSRQSVRVSKVTPRDDLEEGQESEGLSLGGVYKNHSHRAAS